MAVLKLTDGIYNETTGERIQVGNIDATQAADGEWSIWWDVPTAEDNKTIDTDVGAGGRFIFINRDTTNFVSLGWATTVYFTTLQPGEAATGRVPSGTTALYAAADTAAVSLQAVIYKA